MAGKGPVRQSADRQGAVGLGWVWRGKGERGIGFIVGAPFFLAGQAGGGGGGGGFGGVEGNMGSGGVEGFSGSLTGFSSVTGRSFHRQGRYRYH